MQDDPMRVMRKITDVISELTPDPDDSTIREGDGERRAACSLLAKIRDRLAVYSQPAFVARWMPIATAPIDQIVLVWCQLGVVKAVCRLVTTESDPMHPLYGWIAAEQRPFGFGATDQPTYWMPEPPPPVDEQPLRAKDYGR